MNLLIGASSYLGSRIFFDLDKKLEILGTYNNYQLSDRLLQLDITKEDDLSRLIDKYNPKVIIHCANEANPRWCQSNQELANRINFESTKSITKLFKHIKLIYISSVAANFNTNVYSKTKQDSENYIINNHKNYVIIRPSLIIGVSPNKRNDRMMNRLLNDLNNNISNKYDTSWKFKPTEASHVSEIIYQVIKRNITNEKIDVITDQEKSRYELASDILNPFNIFPTTFDANDNTPILESIKDLIRLELPQRTYPEIISDIIADIKNINKITI